MSIGIIGLGQCGTTIANEWSLSVSLPVTSINTTEADRLKGKNINKSYLISNGNLGGMAKEREYIIPAIEADKENFIGFIKEFIKDNKLKGLILISSSGGGSGSGLITNICKLLNERIKLRCIIVTPSFNEGAAAIRNTLDVISELQEYETSIRVVSNNNYPPSGYEINKREAINKYIVATENDILIAGNSQSFIDNLDPAEVDKLLFTKGFSSIYTLKIPNQEDHSNSLVNRTKSSYDIEPSSSKAINSCAFIFFGNEKTNSCINDSKITDSIGTPEFIFKSVIKSDRPRITLIISGCNIGDSILKYKDECQKLLEKNKGFKPLNLQIDIEDKDEEPVVYTVQIRKPKVVKDEDDDWLNDLDL